MMIELSPEILFIAVASGAFATVAMDAWALLLKHAAALPTTDWAMVGRWFGHLCRGRLIHRPIGDSPPIPGELAIGWIAHYAVGVVYALLYTGILVITSRTPTLGSAVLFGLVTLAAPWLVLQPGLGIGVFARFAPRPGLTRAINISMHLIFGAALYPGWLLGAAIMETLG